MNARAYHLPLCVLSHRTNNNIQTLIPPPLSPVLITFPIHPFLFSSFQFTLINYHHFSILQFQFQFPSNQFTMKFLHSPSSSSSSSSTTETRPNYTAIGCIPAILRRLLCSRTLPTFPFDNHIKESFVNNEFYCGDEVKGNPGIVAKLMGLDSMPPVEKLRELKKGNCVLEAPSFVELENEKFIILSFEGGGKDKELKLHSLKNPKGLIESKEKTRNRVDKEMHSCKLSNLGKKPKKSCDTECGNREISRNMKIEKNEIESDSENLSPVSVLEFSDHQEASYSGLIRKIISS